MKLPAHLAIIMDGNGRWAVSRGYARTFGHLRGARVAKNIITWCVRRQIPHLTLYAFSTENWLRPKQEVDFLMQLLGRHLRRERETLMENNIQFSTIGDISRLPAAVLREIETTLSVTANNTGMRLVFALSYGGRQEILEAAKTLTEKVALGQLRPDEITEDLFAQHLQTHFLPDPDLIIRTSGEYRLSNFMTWQSAYSELYISPKMWPDFNEADFSSALEFYATRERRFGQVNAPATPAVPQFHKKTSDVVTPLTHLIQLTT